MSRDVQQNLRAILAADQAARKASGRGKRKSKPLRRDKRGRFLSKRKPDERVRKDRAHQLYYARRTLQKHGVEDDLFDLEHEMDFSLSYAENFSLVIEPILREHSEKYKLRLMEEQAERAWARFEAEQEV